MLGQEFSAREAEQWGLIWSVVEDGELQQSALAIARQLATSDPAILGGIKSLLHEETFGNLGDVLERETSAHGRLGTR
jgi:2-(1,2-epoxy-1,2-dihydrophenyl)acetyl-CoA isomerase